jgi:hypothetical protein
VRYTVFNKQLLIGLFLCFAYAGEMHAWDNRTTISDQYCDNSCECCFNVQVQAGIAPIIWTRRGDFSAISCNASLGCPNSTIGPVVPLFEMPRFNNLFKLPWTVGGIIGYMIDDCTEVYIEANYRQAKAKDNFTRQTSITLPLFVAQPQFVFSSLSKYRIYDFYVGARSYFDPCWCECASFFIGGQVGLVHHKEVDFKLTTSSLTNTCAAAFTSNPFILFGKHTNFAGGANIGLEYCVCGCLSLVLAAEFIATCGPCGSATNIAFAGCVADQVLPELRPLGFIVGGSGTEVFFPITLGLKFDF